MKEDGRRKKMAKQNARSKVSLMQLKAVNAEIKHEFEKLMKSRCSKRKSVLSLCLERLYNSFDSEPSRLLGVIEFLGKKKVAFSL